MFVIHSRVALSIVILSVVQGLRDAPPVLGKELTGNFVEWCAVHIGWGSASFFAEPGDEQDLQLCFAPPCAEGCKRLEQNIAVLCAGTALQGEARMLLR